ncbi:HDOD domain-containing protein|uniref:EAL and modified HD-GYP domain-containing signal transduction protein n=1 Tax=Dendrosporobacter quercicolus TaxID=146817 RepID=A0A1G9SZT8_9FIRM|nr:HDOD domain-containing protein [Dendrosporobacter quercicolus]NSL48579.1 HDOD domain-containing protein [Dendrosporobacter quercicolus DSM 1736]SDM40365.1 EAL and modified HD-GYP domain-containing signal transduction protein [Dendrosporobacter quercicolus]
MNLFVARQPIFDFKRSVIAYELLFRRENRQAYDSSDGDKATEELIVNSFLNIGMDVLTNGKRAFINFTANGITSGIAELLPPDMVAVEILETVEPDRRVIEACRLLKRQGYVLALDDFVFRPGYEPLIGLADIIKVDFMLTKAGERAAVIQRFGRRNLRFLAEKVETQQDFQEAYDGGYSYFQGYFFSKPVIIARKGIPFGRLAAFQLLKTVNSTVLDLSQVEAVIKEELAFSYQLLKYINSSAFGLREEVRSIRHALILLGQRELQKWSSLIALREMGQDKPPELIRATQLRAHFGELIARQLKLGPASADAFLAGQLSLMDAVLDQPMDEILTELPLKKEIKAALLGDSNIYRDILNLCIAYERAEWNEIFCCAEKLGLDEAELPGLYLNALIAIGSAEVQGLHQPDGTGV